VPGGNAAHGRATAEHYDCRDNPIAIRKPWRASSVMRLVPPKLLTQLASAHGYHEIEAQPWWRRVAKSSRSKRFDWRRPTIGCSRRRERGATEPERWAS